MAKILLIGLDENTSSQIVPLLKREFHEIERKSMNIQSVQETSADLVLVSGDDRGCLNLLPAIRSQRPGLPVIVVTRLPETTRWLDALEAGAADYWAAPFERVQLEWLLASALRPRLRAAAA